MRSAVDARRREATTLPSPVEPQVVHEVECLLRQVAIIVRKRGRDILQDFDITPPQFDALLVLDEFRDITMGELGEKMYLACSTATDLIDRMERNGLIERERDPRDRRVIRLKVRPKGHEVIKEVLAARRRYLAGILREIDDADRERLVRSLEQLHALMTQAEVVRASSG